MAHSLGKLIRLLVVDDDPFLASTLGFALKRVFPPDAVVRRVHSVEEAKRIVADERFDAVVTDYYMSDGVGVDLLAVLLSSGGAVPRLFLVSGANPDEIKVGDLLSRHPEITFIEKPFSFDAVARRIREAVLPAENDDGGHHGLELFDLVQAYYLAHKSATLRILLPDKRMGMVVLSEGELVHAALGALSGQEALLEIVRHRKSPIRIEESCMTTRRSINAPTQFVLIDTLRRIDEEIEGKSASESRAKEPQNRPRTRASFGASSSPPGPPPAESPPKSPARRSAPPSDAGVFGEDFDFDPPLSHSRLSPTESSPSSSRSVPSSPRDFGPRFQDGP